MSDAHGEADLTDPDNEHRQADSGDEPTQTERAQIAEYGSPDDPELLAVFRAGWDQGVADRAGRARRERENAPREINTAAVRQALVAAITETLAGAAAVPVGAAVITILDRASAGIVLEGEDR